MKEENQYGVENLQKITMKPHQIAVMIFCLVASGAFGIEDMLPNSGPGLTLAMLVIFPLIWAHPISKMVEELSVFMPTEGGIYVWVKEALGEFWGFCIGWWSAISIYFNQAVYVVLIVDYASGFIPILKDSKIQFLFKLGIVALFTIINLLGLKEVDLVNKFLSVFIIFAFALVTVVDLINWKYNPIDPFIPANQSIVDSLGGSICVVIWMYCGYESLSNMGGELENPEVIPKGFKIAMPLIAISYILPTLAGIVSVGRWSEWGTDGIGYGNVLTQYLGYGWGVFFVIVAIASQAAIFNAYIAAGSREFFAMADDHLCPRFLTKVGKKGEPIYAILLMAICTVVMMSFDFETLLTIVTPLTLMVYILLGIAFLILRKRYPLESRNSVYYIRGNKVKIIIYALAPIIISVIAMLVNGTEYFLLGFVSILSGLIMYLIFKPIYGGLYQLDEKRYPINIRTKLAKGDLQRFGIFILAFSIFAFLGSFFLTWYEGAWGPEYYLATYGSGVQSDFWLMIKIARYGGLASSVIGILLFLTGRKCDPVK